MSPLVGLKFLLSSSHLKLEWYENIWIQSFLNNQNIFYAIIVVNISIYNLLG